MDNCTVFDAGVSLASSADLIGILAGLAAPTHRRVSKRDARLARAAVAQLFPNLMPADVEMPPVIPAPNAGRLPQPKAVLAERPAEKKQFRGRRVRCTCGGCAQCLDNAKWDRIFNEKFADPTYYGALQVRHNSTLAHSF